mmetsp:Transcript_68901/g.109378  ORF Transcript_68901/g.109378 Transcript_68901/m.109378 type:complete len:220 (-) Transcript_68901:305-964(-)
MTRLYLLCPMERQTFHHRCYSRLAKMHRRCDRDRLRFQFADRFCVCDFQPKRLLNGSRDCVHLHWCSLRYDGCGCLHYLSSSYLLHVYVAPIALRTMQRKRHHHWFRMQIASLRPSRICRVNQEYHWFRHKFEIHLEFCAHRQTISVLTQTGTYCAPVVYTRYPSKISSMNRQTTISSTLPICSWTAWFAKIAILILISRWTLVCVSIQRWWWWSPPWW